MVRRNKSHHEQRTAYSSRKYGTIVFTCYVAEVMNMLRCIKQSVAISTLRTAKKNINCTSLYSRRRLNPWLMSCLSLKKAYYRAILWKLRHLKIFAIHKIRLHSHGDARLSCTSVWIGTAISTHIPRAHRGMIDGNYALHQGK